MSTSTHRSAAELQALIAKLPEVAPMTCQQLCDELNNDFDIIQNPQDFPGNIRAKVLAAAHRDIIAVNARMHQQKCPPCE